MESSRTEIRRHPERAVPDQAAAILAQGLVAHVGFEQDGQPFVIPLIYHFDAAEPEHLYLHGSPGSRTLQHLASGAPVCVAVTLLDGLVYSRSAMYHSANYRSVVCFGRGRRVQPNEISQTVFEKMIRRYFAGRTEGRDYERAPEAQLESTALVEIRIDEWSAKSRIGGPKGPLDGNAEAPGTCGVVEFKPEVF